MSQIMKTFLGIYLILMMCLTEVGILHCFLQVMEAQGLQAEVICQLEDSAFAPQVARACFEEAGKQNCSLEITFYEEDGNTVTAASADQIPNDTSDVTLAEVRLTFPIRFPGMTEEKRQVICGYAR